VYDHPAKVAITVLVAALAMGSGILRIGNVIETRSEKLFTPQVAPPPPRRPRLQASPAQLHRLYVAERFGVSIDFINITLTDREAPERGNVLTVPHVREVFEDFEAIAAIEIDGKARPRQLTPLARPLSGSSPARPLAPR